jgi:hypothetical protein
MVLEVGAHGVLGRLHMIGDTPRATFVTGGNGYNLKNGVGRGLAALVAGASRCAAARPVDVRSSRDTMRLQDA